MMRGGRQAVVELTRCRAARAPEIAPEMTETRWEYSKFAVEWRSHAPLSPYYATLSPHHAQNIATFKAVLWRSSATVAARHV
jgi:hypothetical protein